MRIKNITSNLKEININKNNITKNLNEIKQFKK